MPLPSSLKRLLFAVAPRPFWENIQLEWRFFKIRLGRGRLKRAYADAKDVWINFGAGPAGREGWINVDVLKAPNINFFWDCRYPIPLPDQCSKGVFCEHFLEHLGHPKDTMFFLRECLRIMQPKAVLRIIVPDAAAFLHAYCAQGWDDMIRLRLTDEHKDIGYGMTYKTKMEVVNVLFRQFGEHMYAYDDETLLAMLSEAGFSSASRKEHGLSAVAKLLLDTHWRARESLYIEAVK